MGGAFSFDVFLSHSSKDKAVVRELAERLKKDGLRVWFDDWEIRAGDNIPSRIEEGLEASRLLLLCMSASAFGSGWAQLESQTFRFRDPLNRERRFIPLRLDDAEIKGSLAQFSCIEWRPAERERQYQRLLDACAAGSGLQKKEPRPPPGKTPSHPGHSDQVRAVAFSPLGKLAVSGSADKSVRLWDIKSGRCVNVLSGHCFAVRGVAWNAHDDTVLSGSNDKTLRLWDPKTGECRRTFVGHAERVLCVAPCTDGRHVLSGSADGTMRLWDLLSGECLQVFTGHTAAVRTLASTKAWSLPLARAITGSDDHTLRVWDTDSKDCVRVLKGHTDTVLSVAMGPYGRHAVSGSADGTLRFWDVDGGRCLRVLEGGTGINSVAWSPDARFVLSGSTDCTLQIWDLNSGRCSRVLEGHTRAVCAVAWSPDGRSVLSGSGDRTLRLWDLETGQCLHVLDGSDPTEISTDTLPAGVTASTAAAPPPGPQLRRIHTGPLRALDGGPAGAPPNGEAASNLQYTNAKVLLVGDTSVGKTGLSRRLTRGTWKETESTAGAWATQWRLPVSKAGDVEREIWLWDFGGQADQRLIHQLYMDETAVAVLVFDPQREDLFDTLAQWDREISRAARGPLKKLLVAGRIDTGGLRASRSKIEAFAAEHGYESYLETSAKTGAGCEPLKQAILQAIQWEEIPWRSSPLLFKRLKEEIIRLKEEGRVLLRINELRETLHLRLSGLTESFTDEQLQAVIHLLTGPGVVWELAFGSWVLLQPELLNGYAQAVIRTLRSDEHELGRIHEERVLRGELSFGTATPRLPPDEERIVLLAMHQVLVQRGLCLREHDVDGKRPTLLVFPSYYGRERPDLVGHPVVFVSYRFNGFLDDIYATLVVRLHHTQPFEQAELWHYGADFKTALGKRLGIKLTRRAAGAGELDVYFDPAVSVEDKVVFSRYVHEHLLQKANDVERLRHYVCPHCSVAVGNREIAMKRLVEGKPDIICVGCEGRVPLWDELEKCFASPEIQRRVSELQERARSALDIETRQRSLVGDVVSTVALAKQIARELSTRENAIDMEIEFRADSGVATGKKVYLRLQSMERFAADIERHAQRWRRQDHPVLLVARAASGEVRWLEFQEWQRDPQAAGERLDVMSVRRWRERLLEPGTPA